MIPVRQAYVGTFEGGGQIGAPLLIMQLVEHLKDDLPDMQSN
jgi:hypothetical protein